ncbi:hypothetical protein ACFSC6_12085 [Rufibacter sediminis]|uniref:Phage ABA sandwich domain-containing protein n=1 Tax=Rufibacter sediminis TaxID=2762756 RepID=A0ABR6VVI6_9BACT|nr:hypothetical protein [Rufibacter sediminis]MBC3540621.1 hypothetical protein [Rufibacter sediminis]
MTEVKTILNLIETVDPADTAKLDEIDARLWCFVNKWGYSAHKRLIMSDRLAVKVNNKNDWITGIPEYTRSRDALKAIRPKGYELRIYNYANDDEPFVICGMSNEKFRIATPPLKTEELAELHANIQTIAHDRSNP